MILKGKKSYIYKGRIVSGKTKYLLNIVQKALGVRIAFLPGS